MSSGFPALTFDQLKCPKLETFAFATLQHVKSVRRQVSDQMERTYNILLLTLSIIRSTLPLVIILLNQLTELFVIVYVFLNWN